MRSPRSFLLFIFAGIAASAILSGAPTPPGLGLPSPVTYNPVAKIIQGNQPLNQSYVLSITSPSNLTAGVSVPVTLGLSVLSTPGSAVSNATALTFISVSPAVLTFTGPNQSLTTIVTVAVPLGNYAGDYAYKILPSGWPSTTDGISDAGATVNATASPATAIDKSPPAIVLLSPANGTVYTYTPASGIPVTVPINFAASVGTGGAPIDTMQAFIGTTPVGLTVTSASPLSATATGSVQLTAAGAYTVSVVGTNTNGSSSTSSTISVVVNAPPPTITVASPGNNASFNYSLGSAGASVPVSFSASSIYGNISSLTATLDGSPVILALSGVGSATTASGSVLLTVPATGSHALVFSAANAYGTATTVPVTFNVTSSLPAPTVTILTPAGGSTFSRLTGDPATVVNYSFKADTVYGTISSVAVKLDGVPVTAAVSGLGSAAVTGSGSLSFTAGATHAINVTATSAGGSASATTTFAVVQVPPPVCETITWLPPISLNKTIEGGATMPIKFTLQCRGKTVIDTSVLIATYEVFSNGSLSNPSIHHYGKGCPNPPDYAISGDKYQLNFPTGKGVHNYRIEVYTTVAGPLQLIDAKDLFTQLHKKCDGRDDEEDGGGNGNDARRKEDGGD